VAGLAFAQSIVATVEVALLGTVMVIRDPKLFDSQFAGAIFRIISVTGFSVVVASTFSALYPLGTSDAGPIVVVKLSGLTLLTFAVHVGVSAIFGLEEVRPVIDRIRRFILKPIKISY
jgi:hypothetical protein